MAGDHCHKAVLDHHQNGDHFADTLPCEVLEIASFVNADHVVLHILCQAMVVVIAQGRGESSRAVIDRLSRCQNFLGRRLHAFDSCAEITGRARHAPILAVVDEHGKFAKVAFKRRSDRGELARDGRSDLRPMRFAGIVVLSAQTGGATGFDHLLDAKYSALHALRPAFRRLFLPEPALTPRCAHPLKTDRLP